MIEAVLRGARWLDAWLRVRFGPSYHALLGLGLIIEIGRHVHELTELDMASGRLVRAALQLLLYAVLLIHQLGELSAHLAARRERRDARRAT